MLYKKGEKMKICILGAGAYGLALASIFYKNKQSVYVWTVIILNNMLIP